MAEQNSEKFDRWIRTAFVEMNTALEELYFSQENPANVEGVGDNIKQNLSDEGRALVSALAAEGNTGEGFEAAFNVLGNLGLFLGALRRHELTNPDQEEESPFPECSALGMHIGSSLGVAPRFATAHLTTHNKAIDGIQKSFTSLEDEYLFLNHNTYGIVSYKSAGAALMAIPHVGVSNPAALIFLQKAKAALEDVARFNKILFDKLDVARFFFCVRPYYKPYRVGKKVFRGANAGDIAEINQIDLLLGLCRANDMEYGQLMEEKMLYMRPEDQRSLRDCLRFKPLLDEFVDAAAAHSGEEWFQTNATAFLEVCAAHGRTAAQHHNMLFRKYIENPADGMSAKFMKQITASGPELGELAKSLMRLRDLRMAAKSDLVETAHDKIEALKQALGQ